MLVRTVCFLGTRQHITEAVFYKLKHVGSSRQQSKLSWRLQVKNRKELVMSATIV